MVSARRQMQGEESHGFAESMLHLGRILTPSFWTLPSSLSPVQGSCISWPASKHLWDPAGDYGTHAYFQTLTTSQLLTSTRVLKPRQGCIGANIQIQGLV